MKPQRPSRSGRSALPYEESSLLEESAAMTGAVHVPYTVGQDEDGVWCAHAQLRPGVEANGEGDTLNAAIADLREPSRA